MTKKYLKARMSMLEEPDKVWEFKNPWNKPSYRIKRFLFGSYISLFLICKFSSRISNNNNYWQMKLACKRIGMSKKVLNVK